METLESIKGLMAPEEDEAKDENHCDEFAEYVKGRFEKMAESKREWTIRTEQTYGLWDVYQEWLINGENYTKPVRFPTLRDVAMGIRDEILQSPPEARLIPLNGESPSKAQALDFAVQNIKNNVYEKRVKTACLNDMIFYGEGFRRIGYRKIVKDIDGKQIVIWDNVGSQRIDPRNVFLDNFGKYLWDPYGADGKRDCILRYEYSWSTFKDRYKDMEGVNLDGVTPHNVQSSKMPDGHFFKSERELDEQLPQELGVKVYEYINQELGIYALVANGKTILGPLPIKNNHGRIPLVNYKFEERPDSFWGASLAELIAPHIYARDTIFNLEFKGLKLRLQPVLAIDSTLGYNNQRHKAYPGNVWTFNTPTEQGKTIANSMVPVPLAQGDSNGFYAMDRYIESQLVMSTNQDTRAMNLDPNELATQSALKSESKKKRINSLVFANEIEAEAQLTELVVSEVKQYMLEPIETEVNGEKTKRPRKVPVRGYLVDQSEDGVVKFTARQGAESVFRLTEDAAKVDVDVEVIDMRQKTLNQEQRIGRLLQFIPIATNLVTAYASVNPELLKKLDAIGILEQVAEAIDMDLSRTIKSEEIESQETIRREHMAIAAGKTVPIPEGETQKTSMLHLKEHARFRWVHKSGKNTMRETAIWKDLGSKGRRAWQAHYDATIANILKFEEVDNSEDDTSALPMQDSKGGSVNGTNAGAGTKIPLPDGRLDQGAPNGSAQKTLLR